MSDFGGMMHVNFGGVPLVLRGAFKLNPVNTKTEVKTNFDGSIGRVFTPQAPMADVTLEDTLPAGVTWQQLIMAAPTTIAIIEDQIGVIHTFVGAVIEGEPSVNREDGEVSGLKIRGATYQKT
ncbi:tail tube protein [Agrobacterium vitis]|nr:tail tube protein [Agrobacterium vitis]